MALGPGDIAGCNTLLQKRRPGHCLKSCVSLVAKVRTEAYLVTWKDLLHVTRVYPEMRKCLMNQMELSCDLESSGKVSERKKSLIKSVFYSPLYVLNFVPCRYRVKKNFTLWMFIKISTSAHEKPFNASFCCAWKVTKWPSG